MDDENDAQIKDEVLREIPNLMKAESVHENWKILIGCLADMLHAVSAERREKIIRLLAHFNGLLKLYSRITITYHLTFVTNCLPRHFSR